MFLRLREHFGTAGLVIAIVALIAALGGGAYAATGGSGGGKATASAKGKPGPRGKTGKTGKTGPAGPAGPAGPQGPAGPKGDIGAAGANGKDGATGPAGPAGKDGKTGFTETLPSEATETGVWQFIDNGKPVQYVPISFPIPLSASDAAVVAYEGIPKDAVVLNENCPGTAAEPKAEPGYLCVYASPFETGPAVFPGAPRDSYQVTPAGSPEPEKVGVSTAGALLYFETPPAGAQSTGSFAVTAP